MRSESAQRLGKTGVLRINHLTRSVQPYYFGRPIKSTEHDYYSPILLEVSRGLDAAAGQIKVSHLMIA